MFSTLPKPDAARTDLPLAIPNTIYPSVPSTHANDDISGNSGTPLDTHRHNHAPLFLPHDGEQSQSTFCDSEGTLAEGSRDKHICATISHPHALDTVVYGYLGLVVQYANMRGQLNLFRIPDRPGNASTPPTSRRVPAGVARRNRIFALDAIGGVITQPDELSASATLPILAVETESPSDIELGGEVRKAHRVLGETPAGWTESESASLKPADISTLSDSSSSKIKACCHHPLGFSSCIHF